MPSNFSVQSPRLRSPPRTAQHLDPRVSHVSDLARCRGLKTRISREPPDPAHGPPEFDQSGSKRLTSVRVIFEFLRSFRLDLRIWHRATQSPKAKHLKTWLLVDIIDHETSEISEISGRRFGWELLSGMKKEGPVGRIGPRELTSSF